MSEDLQNLGPPVQTAGALLRQARESTGLHIAALAVAMKVPVKKLEALEADRLDTLHDAVFVRALAASMCRTLKIDPLPVLGLLPKTVALQFERDDRGINMPYSSGLLAGNGLRGLFAKPAVLLVAALVIGALAVIWVPQSGVTERAAELLAQPKVMIPANPASAAAAIAAPEAATPMASAAALAIAPAASASVAVVAQAAPASAPASGAEAVVLKASGSAWVRVSDSRGVVQFEKTLSAGESATAGGAMPLSVVLGNAAATAVMVHGQAFDLVAVTKDNVARFEVK